MTSADAAVLAALRAATTPAERNGALGNVLDRAAATSSVPETQRLLDAAFAAFSVDTLLPQLKPVAAVCTAPPRKAESVGHTLVHKLTAYVDVHPVAQRLVQQTLLAVYQANPAVLGGVLSALESSTAPILALKIVRPLLIAALIEASPRHVHKLAVVHALVRTAWSGEGERVRAAVVGILVRATTLTPLSTSADAWVTYPPLAASTVDLLVSGHTESAATATATAQALLRRVFFGLSHQLCVLSLLQSLMDLSAAFPQHLSTTSLLFQLGVVLLDPESGVLEQQRVLRILQTLLLPPPPLSTSGSRSVYLEVLLVPLVSVLPTLSRDAAPLLQLVLDAAASGPLQCTQKEPPFSPRPLGAHAAHAASFLALAASCDACEGWLASRFQHATDPELRDAASLLLLQLGACLVDRRGAVRTRALEALERQLRLRRERKAADDWPPASVKLLVATLVVLTSHRPRVTAAVTVAGANGDALWLNRAFQVLAARAATTTETMKIVLRLIRRMASDAGLRVQALPLLRLVWAQDSRVYPQLEALMRQVQREDAEVADAQLVLVATILALCEKDPETGVDWIAEIQGFLEDANASVVAMAVRAVELLCAADCLDYETAVKSFAVKLKKGRISCGDQTLFQQQLCQFFAVGGAIGFAESSPKYSARVLSDLWGYAEADDAGVRREAFAALNQYSLVALDLRLDEAVTSTGHEVDDEDDEPLTEQEVEENVDRVWSYLQAESDPRVRLEIERLVQKILEAESKRLAPGGASRTGTGVASALAFTAVENRVSAAATKEHKKHLPTRQQVLDAIDATGADWRAFLVAFEPANVVESAAAPKRKDKRLRAVMAHVDEMNAALQRALEAAVAMFEGEAAASVRDRFLLLLQSAEAWRSFARKYFGRVKELALLRTPMDAPEGHTAELLSTLLKEQLTALLEGEIQTPQRWLVAGALILQASSRTATGTTPSHPVILVLQDARAVIRTKIQQSIEELRVFQDAAHREELLFVLFGATLAYEADGDDAIHGVAARVATLLESESSELLHAAVLLFVSQTSHSTHDRLQLGLKLAATALIRFSCGAAPASAAVNLFEDSSSSPRAIVDAVMASAGKPDQTEESVVAWASAMALAQIAGRCASVRRLEWLDCLRLLLERVWEATHSADVAVALAPVLLESVRLNRVGSRHVEHYVAALQLEIESRPSAPGLLVLPYLLQRLQAYGCVLTTANVDALVQIVDHSSSSSPLVAVAVDNFFGGSVGVSLVDDLSSADREVAWEPATVARLVASLRQQQQPPASAFALATIADRAERFLVVQKNKMFDVQIHTLPATSLVFKMLAYLQVGGGGEAEDAVETAQSAAKCLAHASRAFPLPLDLSTLLLRVMSRHAAADGVLIACIELAASHASGVSLLLGNVLSRERLTNYAPEVAEACVDALATARGRLTDEQLISPIVDMFGVLVECWQRDASSLATARAFETWMHFVGKLVEPSMPDESTAATTHAADGASDAGSALASSLSKLVLSRVIKELPFTPAHHDASRALLRCLARDTLAKISAKDAMIEAVTAQADEAFDGWSWWRSGVLLAELLRLGVLRSSSVVFRWLGAGVADVGVGTRTVVDAFSADLVESICVASEKKPVLSVNEAWLLELLERFSNSSGGAESVVLQRRVLFSVAEHVISSTQLRGHEAFLLAGNARGLARESVQSSLPALMAQALVRHHNERSSAPSEIAQRLWTLQSKADSLQPEMERTTTALMELHVTATERPVRLLTVDTQRDLLAQLSMG